MENKKKYILYIGEDKKVLEVLKQSENYQIENITNGFLFDIWTRKKIIPYIIISEMKLKGINGILLHKEIQKYDNFSSVPFILLYQNYTHDQKLQALYLGIDDIYKKPHFLKI